MSATAQRSSSSAAGSCRSSATPLRSATSGSPTPRWKRSSLPRSARHETQVRNAGTPLPAASFHPLDRGHRRGRRRSEEHTSELQSHSDLVCRLLLDKKKTKPRSRHHSQKKKTTNKETK